MAKRAIITGITGQDGSYLAELLLEQGYEVVGTVRRASAPNYWRIQHLLNRITIKPADLLPIDCTVPITVLVANNNEHARGQIHKLLAREKMSIASRANN